MMGQNEVSKFGAKLCQKNYGTFLGSEIFGPVIQFTEGSTSVNLDFLYILVGNPTLHDGTPLPILEFACSTA